MVKSSGSSRHVRQSNTEMLSQVRVRRVSYSGKYARDGTNKFSSPLAYLFRWGRNGSKEAMKANIPHVSPCFIERCGPLDKSTLASLLPRSLSPVPLGKSEFMTSGRERSLQQNSTGRSLDWRLIQPLRSIDWVNSLFSLIIGSKRRDYTIEANSASYNYLTWHKSLLWFCNFGKSSNVALQRRMWLYR